jgi:potassium-transporting ATPase potassium-binding subunit
VSIPGLLQLVLYAVLLILVTKPLGLYMWRVFDGQRTFLSPVVGPLERGIYRLSSVHPESEQGWVGYAFAMLIFSVVGGLLTYAIERLQNVLPFNPQNLDAVAPDLAFNTAMSFTTNTNWQFYAGESTMSYFTQMVALAFHNWVSSAVGMAIAIALVRGLARRSGRTIGNFWVDMVRGTLHVLLPICLIYTLFLGMAGRPTEPERLRRRYDS